MNDSSKNICKYSSFVALKTSISKSIFLMKTFKAVVVGTLENSFLSIPSHSVSEINDCTELKYNKVALLLCINVPAKLN